MQVVGENFSEVTAMDLKYCRRNCLIVHATGVGVFKCGVFYWFYYMENASNQGFSYCI